MSASALTFDDFRTLLKTLPGPSVNSLVAARERDAQLTKPPGALGRLEEIAFWLAAWSGRAPAVNRPLVAIFAGNHGVTAQGVSPFPSSVTQQMVENFAAGGAAINQICVTHDLGLKIFDLALEFPTGDITQEAALSERDCAATRRLRRLSSTPFTAALRLNGWGRVQVRKVRDCCGKSMPSNAQSPYTKNI